MKKVFGFVKGKSNDKKDSKLNPQISIEVTNASGQKIACEGETIIGLHHGYSYEIDLNGKDKNLSKLHKAVWIGNLEKVKLHGKKIDINSLDSSNRTPLHLAVAQGHTDIAWYLINNNALLDICDNDGFTPLMKAIDCGKKDCVNLLIECGSNIHKVDKHGNTGLHLAAARGFCNIAAVLLKEGLQDNVSNSNGEYAIHLATACDHRDLVQFLICYGGNVEAVDKERRTPLMLAARSGFISIIKLLLSHKAKVTTADSNGWTAEDYACFGGHQDLIELLKNKHNEETIEEEKERQITESQEKLNLHENNVEVKIEVQSENESYIDNSPESPRVCVTPPQSDIPKTWDLRKPSDQQVCEIPRPNLLPLKESFLDNLDHSSLTPDLSPIVPIAPGEMISADKRLSPIPPSSKGATPERRARSPLERVNSLDLPSDQDSPLPSPFGDKLDEDYVFDANQNQQENLNMNTESEANNNDFKNNKTLVNDNLNKILIDPQKINIDVCSNINKIDNNARPNVNSLDDEVTHSCESLDRKNVKHATNNQVSSSLDNLDDINSEGQIKGMSIEIIQSTGKLDDTLSVCTIKGVFKESHSLDLLDSALEDSKSQKGNRRHSRNLSITLSSQPQGWRSVDVIPTSSNERGLPDIDSQLQCYDEALRQLAKVNMLKTSKSLDLKSDSEQKDENFDSKLSKDNFKKEQLNREPDIIPLEDKSVQSSLESDKDDNFPPPPVYFMENDNEIIEITGSSDILNVPYAISTLTPIKENNNEQDSLSIVSDGTEVSDGKPCPLTPVNTFSNEFTKSDDLSNIDSTIDNISTTGELNSIISYHLEGGDVFLPEQRLPEYYHNCFVDVKSLRLRPNDVDLNKITIPPDSPSPKVSPKSRLQRGEIVKSVDSIESKESTPVSKAPQFEIGGICSASAKIALVKPVETGSERISEPLIVRKKNKGRQLKDHDSDDDDVFGDNDDDDEEDETDDSREENDPPFWLTTDKGGCFSRQNTVISVGSTANSSVNIPSGNVVHDIGDASNIGNESGRGSGTPSSEAETLSAADSPSRNFKRMPKVKQTVQSILYDTTLEKGRLEEAAANLRDKAERLQFELEDARQSEAAMDDTISILQNQLVKVEARYSKAQEELCTVRQRATNAEHELQHLRQLCSNLNEEKKSLSNELTKHISCKSNNFKYTDQSVQDKVKQIEQERKHEEEKNIHLVHHLEEVLHTNKNMVTEREALIAQNIADVRKLQEDTLCWKERYEECAAKLELMQQNQDPRLIEAHDTIATLKRTISVLQQEKISQPKFSLQDASTSPNTPRKLEMETDMIRRPNMSISIIQKELSAIRQQLESSGTCTPTTTGPPTVFMDDMDNAQRKMAELQQQLAIELAKRQSLEQQLKKVLADFQERLETEIEFDRLHQRLEKEFVSKHELEKLRNMQNEAIGRIKQQALLESETKLSKKLSEINEILQQQLLETTRLNKERTMTEIALKKDVEQTKLKLQQDISKIQAALEAKELEEKKLKIKCDQLAKEIEKNQTISNKTENIIENTSCKITACTKK